MLLIEREQCVRKMNDENFHISPMSLIESEQNAKCKKKQQQMIKEKCLKRDTY